MADSGCEIKTFKFEEIDIVTFEHPQVSARYNIGERSFNVQGNMFWSEEGQTPVDGLELGVEGQIDRFLYWGTWPDGDVPGEVGSNASTSAAIVSSPNRILRK